MESDPELLHDGIVFDEEFEKHCSNYTVRTLPGDLHASPEA
jgi:hypothetical protein